jgi:DNA repair protein RadC
VYSSADDGQLLDALLGRSKHCRAEVSLAELLESDSHSLAARGFSPTARHRLLACSEVARRYQPRTPATEPITRAAHAVAHLAALREEKREIVAALLLDARLRALRLEIVATGGAARVSVSPSDILRPALLARAGAMIIAHNHPTGDVEPSRDDVEFTSRMVAAGDVLGVEVLDHLIVARRGFFSFRESGWPGTSLTPISQSAKLA